MMKMALKLCGGGVLGILAVMFIAALNVAFWGGLIWLAVFLLKQAGAFGLIAAEVMR